MKEIDKTLEIEGGYSDSTTDRGGETNWGISKRSYPEVDIAKLTKAEASEIAKRDFFDKLRCGEIKSLRVRWKLFDIGFNAGTSTAAKILQRAVNHIRATFGGLKEDGIIGSQTLEVVNNIVNSSVGENAMLNELVDQQVSHYVEIAIKDHSQIANLRGWIRRAQDRGTGLV